MTIYKHTLPFQDQILIALPEGAEVLTFQNQNEKACIWVRCNPKAPSVVRHFRMCGTGLPCDDGSWVNAAGNVVTTKLKCIASAQFNDGQLVFHLFEEV